MGSFTTSHAVTYDIGDGSGSGGGFNPPQAPQTQTTGGQVITDGDVDNTFETGDTCTFGIAYTYAGTMVIDGVVWPAFQGDAPFNDFLTVFMDQAPMSVPATPSVTPNATYNGACFCAGTLIATPTGERKVEDLQIGDLVSARNGRPVPVLWIGRQKIHAWRVGRNMQPVRFRRGSLGHGLPHSDLTVTADHGMVMEDHVINASALVNGTTVDWVPMSELKDCFTVYHVETEGHEVILANGAMSESFIDYRDRRAFDNFDEYLDLYGCERIIPEMPAPRISSARHLPQALKELLFDGSAPLRKTG